MDRILAEISRGRGLAATHELLHAGIPRAQIALAVRTRRILRVRQGWYARPDTDRTLLAAARVGGRATCATGLRLHGIWSGARGQLHVACSPHDARLRSPRDSRVRLSGDGVNVHWRPLPPNGSRLILDPLNCLRDALGCLDPIDISAAADSLLHAHPHFRAGWQRFVMGVAAVHRTRLALADGVCESGIETRLWLHLRLLGVPVDRQVRVEGVGFVDFIAGRRLVIEADGGEYHTDVLQFETDRRRDARLAALGFQVLRFSYRQVMECWPEVESAIARALN